MKSSSILFVAVAAVCIAAVSALPALAAGTVKIGVIYPLTGNAASAGQSAKDAVELGVEIVNGVHPELKAMPLDATGGLPNLGGAKIELANEIGRASCRERESIAG